MRYVGIVYLSTKVYERQPDGMINPKVLDQNNANKIIVEADTAEECKEKTKEMYKKISEIL